MARPPRLAPCVLLAHALCTRGAGLLFPQDSESREVKDLSGLWRFKPDYMGQAAADRWQTNGLPEPTMLMPVPCSYNDMTQDRALRDLVGTVWYEREVFIPLRWLTHRVSVYVGSANYYAQVWMNGAPVGSHEGGHLPFVLTLEPYVLNFGRANRLSISVNNTLTSTTVPAGVVQLNVAGRRVQRLQMDFFNYAGIHRQVLLFTTPQVYLDDVSVTSRLENSDAFLNVFVGAVGASTVLITLKDALQNIVARGRMPADARRGGRLTVQEPHLWWPRYMSTVPGYMYTIQVEVLGADGNVSDVYRLPYGIRTVSARPDEGFMINGQRFYFHGFGKHEDAELRGRGLDLPTLVKDFELLQWVGGNSVRTAHYPYSTEFMRMCDRLGIVVIDEVPAVGLQAQNMVRETLIKHAESITEMISRDKNHPSVVMWSLANEPDSESLSAAPYFKHVASHARALDPSRPLAMATFKNAEKDQAVQYVDVIMVNRYFAWYTNTGQLDIIPASLERDMLSWRRAFRKLVMLSEYGADTVAGLHADPSYAFTEEFQCEFLSQHFAAFDKLRSAGFFIGEHVWNFADFMTAQGVTRVYGNKKGIFTRQRQPKMAAYTMRSRYLQLANATRRFSNRLSQLQLPKEAQQRAPQWQPQRPQQPTQQQPQQPQPLAQQVPPSEVPAPSAADGPDGGIPDGALDSLRDTEGDIEKAAAAALLDADAAEALLSENPPGIAG